jgi:repressor LexA
MENKQAGRGKRKETKRSIDLRQLDMWSTGAAGTAANSASPVRHDPKKHPHVTEAKTKSKRVTRTAAKQAPVKVTVSAPPRAVVSPTARALPALTRRQHELLDYLRRRSAEQRLPPSLTEICRDLGLASRGSLHKQVVALVKAGLVEPMHGKQRGVRLMQPANDSAIALLGLIAAGRPIEALTRDETIEIPSWLRAEGDCYALRVRGDSMREAGILDGDIVVVAARDTARRGEMVVALIDGQEATLKRIEPRPDEVVLHAENPAYPAQHYAPERVRIQGVVIAQLRRY